MRILVILSEVLSVQNFIWAVYSPLRAEVTSHLTLPVCTSRIYFYNCRWCGNYNRGCIMLKYKSFQFNY